MILCATKQNGWLGLPYFLALYENMRLPVYMYSFADDKIARSTIMGPLRFSHCALCPDNVQVHFPTFTTKTEHCTMFAYNDWTL